MPRKKRKGKTTKKNQNKAGGPAVEGDRDERSKAPHSFVIHRGKTGKCVQDLTSDVRKVMEPYTASNIKVWASFPSGGGDLRCAYHHHRAQVQFFES